MSKDSFGSGSFSLKCLAGAAGAAAIIVLAMGLGKIQEDKKRSKKLYDEADKLLIQWKAHKETKIVDQTVDDSCLDTTTNYSK